MISKIDKRKRRAKKTRAKIKELEAHRLCIHRSSNHIYAQIIAPDNHTVAATSSLDPEIKNILGDKVKGKIDIAKAVGQKIAEKAKKAKINKVAFDRSGFLYHGRVKALAESARENGLDF
ncbi:MAG TPA: 50S ribosomal protein L18 [SAR86 cluster bacterium]|jgi:large subunit ribosomal protein L18|nr:50S ribosomal protein L18 [Gammaproteobacteria bacterium]HJM15728.1 50S ribosomal protein L18 [SAR86 cluster bacterium]MBQ09576.1 50S ribosomal protein L18 [Gammaproteobacteria bacterium]MDP6146996.1 50S ribosomal protein L18 [Gammaproteobacteria bacterium]HJL79894.1 50S ribosomal protein L18 [Gammaproteobacteria bacterium]|tara:strand:+ start:1367 stop:1726 length:360 start_codon:yes stop_codon:yes gene_type:complete